MVGTGEPWYEPTFDKKNREKNEMKSKSNPVDGTSKQRPTKVPLISRCKVANGGYREKVWREQGVKKVLGDTSQTPKKQYENFPALSSESLDQTFDRIQKLIRQLEIQGEVINQEDMRTKVRRVVFHLMTVMHS
ncbi:hypothetical protein Tco_0874052 [Tanacetum coccineum]|uniref:Uncharacterized protein n=1 Tax=Tanacetum coccineum TaxID=301880 RepID=A0ABQ5BNP0_9ASTR